MPGIMLGGITRRQELHSRGGGKGNFAPWGLLDWIHGTSIGADVVSPNSSVCKTAPEIFFPQCSKALGIFSPKK